MSHVTQNIIRWNAVQCALALCEEYRNKDHRAERIADAKRHEANIKYLADRK